MFVADCLQAFSKFTLAESCQVATNSCFSFKHDERVEENPSVIYSISRRLDTSHSIPTHYFYLHKRINYVNILTFKLKANKFDSSEFRIIKWKKHVCATCKLVSLVLWASRKHSCNNLKTDYFGNVVLSSLLSDLKYRIHKPS